MKTFQQVNPAVFHAFSLGNRASYHKSRCFVVNFWQVIPERIWINYRLFSFSSFFWEFSLLIGNVDASFICREFWAEKFREFMAPFRKKGVRVATASNCVWNIGDLVLAKVKGHPWWPARVSFWYDLCVNPKIWIPFAAWMLHLKLNVFEASEVYTKDIQNDALRVDRMELWRGSKIIWKFRSWEG